ncbi:MAG: septation ring formation regulator EzrA, partial [Candidatus Limosilactobacillus intestinavium]
MLQILIGILIIALIVLAIIFFYQKRIITVTKELSTQVDALDGENLAKKLDSNHLEGLMGESLKKFTALRELYDHDFVDDYQKAQDLVKSIQKDLHGKAVFSTSSQVTELQKLVSQLNTTQSKLKKGIDELDQAVKTQSDAIKQLREEYNAFGRQLDEKSFDYGNSKDELQSRLVNLEKKFEHFSDVVSKGDHDAAQELLNDLQERTSAYQKLMDEIPGLYRPLYAVFPDQLKELKSGYADLTKQQYRFTDDDIDKQVDELEKERQMALKKLANLNIAPVKEASEHL